MCNAYASGGASEAYLSMAFPGTALATRDALHRIIEALAPLQLSTDQQHKIELVLAEVFNNVVEHAYAAVPDGMVEVDCRHERGQLDVHVYDKGVPFPESALPGRPLAAPEDLPEGGFGWFLIRELSDALTYRREAARNHLHLVMNLAHSKADMP